jgi:hypothetical protein
MSNLLDHAAVRVGTEVDELAQEGVEVMSSTPLVCLHVLIVGAKELCVAHVTG